ncbi:MAG TPA: hypothetical protein VJH88_01060 [Candidatus Nanoarchaeia archaeon]|nr:hypothetical protein [Candidatus Nanoarchaeia archaeon]
MNLIDRWKIKRAFLRVKYDLVNTRKRLSDGLFSLTSEYAKMQLRIQHLELKVEQLEAVVQQKQSARLEYPDYAQSY